MATSSAAARASAAMAAAEAAAIDGDRGAAIRAQWIRRSLEERREGIQKRRNREWEADDGDRVRMVLRRAEEEKEHKAAARAARKQKAADKQRKRRQWNHDRERQVLEGMMAKARDDADMAEWRRRKRILEAAEYNKRVAARVAAAMAAEEEAARRSPSITPTVIDSSSSEEPIPTIVIDE